MKFTKLKKKSLIDEEIDRTIKYMTKWSEDTDRYNAALCRLERLTRAKTLIQDKPKVSPDTIAIIAGNLLGITLILGYEQGHIITTKALGFIIKGRV